MASAHTKYVRGGGPVREALGLLLDDEAVCPSRRRSGASASDSPPRPDIGRSPRPADRDRRPRSSSTMRALLRSTAARTAGSPPRPGSRPGRRRSSAQRGPGAMIELPDECHALLIASPTGAADETPLDPRRLGTEGRRAAGRSLAASPERRFRWPAAGQGRPGRADPPHATCATARPSTTIADDRALNPDALQRLDSGDPARRTQPPSSPVIDREGHLDGRINEAIRPGARARTLPGRA